MDVYRGRGDRISRQFDSTCLSELDIDATEAPLSRVDSGCGVAADTLQSKRTCIIVCGMHRTGTSAVARVISLLGADLPKNLLPPNEDNIRGFWEPNAVVRVHDELLDVLGSSYADPLPLPRNWLGSAYTQEAQAKLARIIEADFSESRLFVVKDPRIAQLLPMWLELFDHLHVDTGVVIPFRNPLEVAASLKRRDSMSLATSLLLYVDSYLNSELASRGRRRCFVSYSELLSDWRNLQQKLTSILGNRFSEASSGHSIEIERYLSPDLRHHQYDRDDLTCLDDVPRIVVDLYDLLNEAASSGDSFRLRKSFDQLRQSADEAAMLYRTYVMGERAKWKEAVKQFEHSTSWRLTAPLRWIRRTAWRR